ncbi:FAD-binding oxidoreductase [Humibacter ginsenosidimutans]|uniref:FAD-binding oxidoreductase n=1 Tax=Humibacter ginsenosidimutans TaxID=2599293 RepID=A0A5B8M300_9MICO|nr:FAD-binding oxidoreductase [Humibacter ginsenosidimutans]QDZ14324.1 FAD-binding oxidoreductase [Humibacter ginsenosidimutans]
MTDVLSAAEAAESLRGLLPGRLFLPGDDGYDAARTPWNTAAVLAPAAVAVPESVADVQAVVRAAADAHLRLAPMSTGHAGMLLSSVDLASTVLVRLTSLTGVSVDERACVARVLGGTVWDDVVAAAHPHGLTGLHGSAGGIAVAGFALNGGLSFYGRKHGLCANSVRAVELVTADGGLRRVDAEHDPDLFWALRGGGGNFGIVTAIEVELVPYSDVVAGMMLWDRSRAVDVMRAWRDLTVDAPESVTTSLRVMSFPPLPDLPPFLAGRDVIVVDGAFLESDERASALLAPLRALQPEIDTVRRIPTSELPLMHMDPPRPSPAVSGHCVLGELSDDTIDAYLDQVGPGTRSGLLSAELRQLGGAFARRSDDGGAVSSIDGAYALYAVAIAPTPEAVAHGRASASSLVQALEPWSLLHSRVPTFIDDAVDAADVYGDACDRLASVAARVDPQATFQAGHSIR